jgi:hypothetical protein
MLISQGEAFSLTPMQTVFVADAHCGDGKRFVVRADEKLTALIELESAIKRDHPEFYGLSDAKGKVVLFEDQTVFSAVLSTNRRMHSRSLCFRSFLFSQRIVGMSRTSKNRSTKIQRMGTICNGVFKMRKTSISRASTNALANVCSCFSGQGEIRPVILR